MTVVFTGDTIELEGTFTERVPEGEPVGSVDDPDSNACTISIYFEEKVIQTGAGVRESTGIYTFDWTVPLLPGIYWVEFKGLFNGKPELRRKKYSAKFKGDQ